MQIYTEKHYKLINIQDHNMILKNIGIQLQIDGGNKETISYCYSFKKKSRHIFNYIERNCLQQLKFESEEFKAIAISLRYGYENRFMNVEPEISSNKSLHIVLPFDKNEYDTINNNESYRELLYKYILMAFEKAQSKYIFPSSEILESYKELENKKFVNEWIFKKKIDKTRKITAELHCSLTIEKFELSLKVKEDKKGIYDEIILETDPDEIAFEYRFKDIIIEKDKIIITDKRKKTLKEILLRDIR